MDDAFGVLVVGSGASAGLGVQAPCRDGNNAWLKRGPNYIRMIWRPIGKCFKREEPRSQSTP